MPNDSAQFWVTASDTETMADRKNKLGLSVAIGGGVGAALGVALHHLPYTQLCITQEQLELIRALRGPVSYESPQREKPLRPFPDNPNGPVDFELKISS
jgi:hypothetical protein